MNNDLRKAGFGKRLVAFLIDHIILSIVSVFGLLFFSWELFIDDPGRLFVVFPIFMLVAFFLYCFKDIVGGASIGKRAMGLIVRNVDDTETKPSMTKLFLRNILSFLWPLELLMILCSKDKRKIGDNLAGTDVYSVSRKIRAASIVIIALLSFIVFIASLVFGTTAIMRNDDSFRTAISYIEASEEIRDIIGDVTGHGFFVQGGISVSGGRGSANFLIRVIGEKGDMPVAVWLERSPGTDWEIVNISY